MKRELNRRNILLGAGVMSPFAGLAVLGNGRPAEATPSNVPHPLVGQWHVDILFSEEEIPAEKGLFFFSLDGVLLCTNTVVRDLGMGGWSTSSLTHFDFTFRHHMFSPDGEWLGHLDVEHSGSLTSNTFESSGTGSAYDQNGELTDVSETSATAVRFN